MQFSYFHSINFLNSRETITSQRTIDVKAVIASSHSISQLRRQNLMFQTTTQLILQFEMRISSTIQMVRTMQAIKMMTFLSFCSVVFLDGS